MDTVPTQHPPWCFLPSCTIATGGVHRSRSRILVDDSATERPNLTAALVEAGTGGPRVWLDGGTNWSLQLTLDATRMLARILRDLSFAGRRAEQ